MISSSILHTQTARVPLGNVIFLFDRSRNMQGLQQQI